MYRILIGLVLLLEPGVGQIDQAPKTTYMSHVFGNRIEGRPFQARYTIKRSWTLPGNEPSEAETGSLFRDSKGRLSKMADEGVQCRGMQGCHWIQDPVTDSLFRGLRVSGKPIIGALSSALDFDFFDGDPTVASDGTLRLSEGHGRIWFNMPQPAVLPDEDAKSIGQRLIEGFDCQGFVFEEPFHIPGGYKIEYWVASEIQRIVYEKITAGNTRQTYRLYDIQRAEPPTSMFIIPKQ
jgi:hypothetical protein